MKFNTITKKDFYNILKYGKDHVEIRDRIDQLCNQIIKLGGGYSITHSSKTNRFTLNVHIPDWNNPHETYQLATDLGYEYIVKPNNDLTKLVRWSVDNYNYKSLGFTYCINSKYYTF